MLPPVPIDPMLEERTIDIVAEEPRDRSRPIGKLAGSCLFARRIASYPYVLCASPDYIARPGAPDCLRVREDVTAGRLLRLLEAHEAYDRSVYAVYPHSRYLPAKLRAFLDHLVDHFGPGTSR